MRRIRIIGCAVMAAAAMSAVAAGPAAAKSSKLDLTYNFEESQVKPGNEFDLYSNEVTVATSIGNVTCSGEPTDEYNRYGQGISGIDETNDEATDKIQLGRSFGSLDGGKYCPTTTALGSDALVYLFSEEEPLGTLGLTSKGKAEFKTTKSNPVYLYLGFTGGAFCYYTLTKLKGTVNATAGLEKDVTTFSKQKLKLFKADSSSVCPKTANITLPFIYSLSDTDFYIFEKTVS